MERKFILQSKVDGLTLHGWLIEPEGEKKGVVQVLHGMREFKERYESFMRTFAAQGYVVVCHDHRGHGDSLKSLDDLGCFYEKTGRAIVQDAVQVTEFIQSEYPGLPITLFGHSMGSMVTRCYLQENDHRVQRAIICGTPKKNPLCKVGILLASCISAFRGGHYRSKLLVYLSTGAGAKKFEHEGEGGWLSHDRVHIEKFYANPKAQKKFTANGYINLFRLLKRTYTKKAYKLQNPDLPILFISGSEDAVLGSKDREGREEKFNEAVHFMQEVGYTHAFGKIYQGLRHELFNDFGKEEAFADMFAFIEKE
jgi:alpha-beta hydrolase superfamily lysophospholipase